MIPIHLVYTMILGLALLVFVINAVRTHRLQERYALLWLLAGLTLTIAPLLAPWLDQLAYALGFAYTPALLLMLAVIGLLLLIFQLSLSIAHGNEQLKVLTQEVGLLRQELEMIKKQPEPSSGITLQPARMKLGSGAQS
jgi:hypothetical protein